MSRANPCKGRELGCTADCPEGGRCDPCRKAHNARETARRQARKAARRCTVCGRKAARVGGQALTTCPTHREYYATRARLGTPNPEVALGAPRVFRSSVPAPSRSGRR